MQAVEVYCPVCEAVVRIKSSIIDDVGQFTKFILWCLGKGYTIEEIDGVIEIGENVIGEELTYLCGIGFVKEDDGIFSLREKGRSFLYLMEIIEIFNSSKQMVNINCTTGKIQRFNNNIESSALKKDFQKFPSIVSWQLFYNKNYGNSKDFVIENYNQVFEHLNDVQIESLYVELEITREPKFVKYRLDDVLPINQKYSLENMDDINVVIEQPIDRIRYNIIDTRLDKHRHLIPSLLDQKNSDKKHLSFDSMRILNLLDEEKKLNSKNNAVYVDSLNCKVFPSFDNKEIEYAKIKIKLPKYEYQISDQDVKSVLNLKMNYLKASKTSTDEIIISRFIPFSAFKECED